jgi:hypothetical protein
VAYTTGQVSLRFDNRFPLPVCIREVTAPPPKKNWLMAEELNLVRENSKTILLLRTFEEGKGRAYATAYHSSIIRPLSIAQNL